MEGYDLNSPVTIDEGLANWQVQLNRVLGVRDDSAGWEAIREVQRQLAHEVSIQIIAQKGCLNAQMCSWWR